MLYFILLSFFAGIAIAIQANINSKLGVYLTSSLLATAVVLVVSFVFTSIAITLLIKEFPTSEMIKTVPIYLWFTGGLLSAFALASFFFVIPKIGILSMISFSLAGQLMYSLISSHYGWFGMPITAININKTVGIVSMLTGIFLINKG